MSYHSIYFAIEKIGELAEILQLHPHSFRHTYSTELLLMGVDPTHARKLTGHQSEKAFRRYTLRGEQSSAIAAYYRAAGEETDQQDWLNRCFRGLSQESPQQCTQQSFASLFGIMDKLKKAQV